MTENKELELESEITEEQEMEDIKIQGVFLFLTTIRSLDPLSDEEFGEVIRAVANYAETGVLPELDDGHSAAMLNLQKGCFEASCRGEKRCGCPLEQRRIIFLQKALWQKWQTCLIDTNTKTTTKTNTNTPRKKRKMKKSRNRIFCHFSTEILNFSTIFQQSFQH